MKEGKLKRSSLEGVSYKVAPTRLDAVRFEKERIIRTAQGALIID